MANIIKPSGVAVGKRFGRLVVVIPPSTQKMVDSCTCQCDCGAVKEFKVHNLVGGLSTSCGCSRKEGWTKHSLVGKKFGRLTVIGLSFRQGKRRRWPCQCDCGKKISVQTNKLLTGFTKSCGCLQRESTGKRSMTHGESRGGISLRLSLLYRAKVRAKGKNVPFGLTLDDIIVPDRCSLLDIPLEQKKGRCHPNMHTIDEVTPGVGYVPGNIQVISMRANTIKSDATMEELERLVRNLKLQRERLNDGARIGRDAIVQSHENTNCEDN